MLRLKSHVLSIVIFFLILLLLDLIMLVFLLFLLLMHVIFSIYTIVLIIIFPFHIFLVVLELMVGDIVKLLLLCLLLFATLWGSRGAKDLGRLRSIIVAQLLQILIKSVGQHDTGLLIRRVHQGVVTTELLNVITVALIALRDHLLSLLLSLHLFLKALFLLLPFFPFLVGDASHDSLICLCLLFTFLLVFLDLL